MVRHTLKILQLLLQDFKVCLTILGHYALHFIHRCDTYLMINKKNNLRFISSTLASIISTIKIHSLQTDNCMSLQGPLECARSKTPTTFGIHERMKGTPMSSSEQLIMVSRILMAGSCS